MATKSAVKHELIPLHEKLSNEEREKLLKELQINFKDLPKIYLSDPSLNDMDVKVGDIIKVARKSGTAKLTNFYRGIIDA